MVHVTLDEAAGSVKAPSGEQIRVTVDENPTTGYQWKIETLTGPLSLVSSDFDAAPDGRPGRGGTRTIVVHADRRGTGELRICYERSWQAGSTESERRTLTVNVE
jgi:inhibitor of cysteine peptidase